MLCKGPWGWKKKKLDSKENRKKETANMTNLAQKEKCGQIMAKVTGRNSENQIIGDAAIAIADGAMGTIGAFFEESVAQSAGKIVGSALGAFAGPFAAFGVSAMFEMFMPDPNNERITNLEEGMACLHEQVLQLEADVEKLEVMIERNVMWISTLSQLPLMKKISSVKTLVFDNKACAQLLRCVKPDNSNVKKCQNDNLQLTTTCGATAFSDKLLKTGAYYFLREEPINNFNQQVVMQLFEERAWKLGKDFLGQYLGLFLSLQFLWNSLEEWAAAICPDAYIEEGPDVCSEEDRTKIKVAFRAFKEYILFQIEDEKVIKERMEKAAENASLVTSDHYTVRHLMCPFIVLQHDVTETPNNDYYCRQKKRFNSWYEMNNATRMKCGTWQLRTWMFRLDMCNNVEQLGTCLKTPCSVHNNASMEAHMLKVSRCETKPGGWPDIIDRKLFPRNEFGNSVYDQGKVCAWCEHTNVGHTETHQGALWCNMSYKEYYNELDPLLEKFSLMAEMLRNRTLKMSQYRQGKRRYWAVSGSFKGYPDHGPEDWGWYENKSIACLQKDMHEDPYKGWGIGATCCNESKGIRTDRNSPLKCEPVTFEQAKQSCEDDGLRLCTMMELAAGRGQGKGCGFDAHLIWSMDLCPLHNNTLMVDTDELGWLNPGT